MAEIIYELEANDGYNICFLVSNESHVLHFVSKPSDTDRDLAILELENRLMEEMIDEKFGEFEEIII